MEINTSAIVNFPHYELIEHDEHIHIKLYSTMITHTQIKALEQFANDSKLQFNDITFEYDHYDILFIEQ